MFMLCYNISDPSTLFSAINSWVPELRSQAPTTPIILVGCQSDLRTDRNVIQNLAKVGKSPVSSQQALSMSQQIQAVMYVETSAKTSIRGVASALEVAALTSLGQISPPPTINQSNPPSSNPSPSPVHMRQNSLNQLNSSTPPPAHHRQSSLITPTQNTPSPMISKKHRNRSLSVTRHRNDMLRTSLRPLNSSLMSTPDDSLLHIEPSETFWDQFHTPKDSFTPKSSPRTGGEESPVSSRQSEGSPRSPTLNSRSKMGSLSSMSMRSKSSTLSSTKSDASMHSVSNTKAPTISITTKTPKQNRKTPEKDKTKTEKMITIKCQRLTADRTYEEVEIEVPAPVYETMQNYTENGTNLSRQTREKRGIGTKIKCLFSKTAS